ncbi:MAG: hypothetical protein HQL33_04500 [Alphaproteobacteria bacterium]|nr:hypothetical protein [Alphaproteobacteria bacterium]MBF0129232.1 hypothetical protein [Alphaproteobacteria bacterium]
MIHSNVAFPGKHGLVKRHAARSSHSSVLGLGLLLGAVVLGIAGYAVVRSNAPPPPTATDLVEEMTQAARGSVVHFHALGGALRAARIGNRVVVTAEGIPPDICVQAGWTLARRGIVTINGTTPARVSAAALSSICNQGSGPVTISWAPRQ